MWQYVKGMADVLLGIGIFFISIQQWKLSKNKAKFELYEKRYEAYTGLKKFLSSVVTHGTVVTEELVSFRWKFEEHQFLFDKKINAYIGTVYKNALEFRRLSRKLSKATGEERKALASQESAQLGWLIDQLEESKKKFDKYLRIS